jgi:hypothetical protein
VTLIHHFPEEFALGILLAMKIPLIARVRDKALLQNPDDIGVGENEPTARDSVVSSAAQRVAVHDPHEEWFALSRGGLPGLQQIRHPGNLGPPLSVAAWHYRSMDRFELGRIKTSCLEAWGRVSSP